MAGSEEWLFGGVDALSWSIRSLGRSPVGVALFAVAAGLAVLGVTTGHPLIAVASALALAYAVVVVTIQARDTYRETDAGLPAVLREGIGLVPVVFGILFLCVYAAFVLTVLGGAFVVVIGVLSYVLGLEFAALLLLPVAVHVAVRVAIAVPVAVVDGVGPLAALEGSVDRAPSVLPRLFGLLTVLSAAALPVALIDLLVDGVPGLVLAFVAGGLSAVGVTALTRVYLEARDDDRDERLPSLRSVLRRRLRRVR